MTDINFLRRYVMRCGKKGKKGFEIGNIHNAAETALHISFSIEKSNVESPNNAKIQIWNLSNKNLKILESKNCIVELKAGYEDSMALVLVGYVASVITTQDNADRLTEIEVVDGLAELRDTVISVSYNGKINSKKIYKHIAGKMGLSIVFAKDLTYKTLPNGFSYVGKAKNALKKVSKCCKHSWTIQNHVLQITRPGRAVSTKGYLLSSDTGLIRIPKRITIGSGGEEQTGWEVEYLLNGAIGVNDVVKLKSSTASGYFLVYKITMDGDNLEGDWICTAQLLKIREQPKLNKKSKKKTEKK